MHQTFTPDRIAGYPNTSAQDDMDSVCDVYSPWDDGWMIGHHRRSHWPYQGISVWHSRNEDDPDLNPNFRDRLLRYGHQSCRMDFICPLLDADHGVGIAMPVWGVSDEATLTAVALSLKKDLACLLTGPMADTEPADSLPDDLRSTSSLPRFLHTAEMSSSNRAALAAICADCGMDDIAPDQAQVEFLFDDLPVRAIAHASHPCLIFDFYLMDASPLLGSMREMLMNTILLLNQTSAQFASMSFGMDHRHFIVATGCIGLEDISGKFQALFERWIDIADEARWLLKTLVLEDVVVEFEAGPGPIEEAEWGP